MPSSDLELRARFANARPGMSLIAVENMAIPVTVVGTHVVALQKKALPLVQEFVLRATGVGVDTVEQLASLYGVDSSLILDAVSEQSGLGFLKYSDRNGKLSLTPSGTEMSRDMESVQPVQIELPVAFDRVTWGVANYRRHDLLSKAEIVKRAFVKVPAVSTRRISGEDVSVEAVNGLLRRGTRSQRQLQVLNVRRLSPTTHRYLPAKLLVFAGGTRGKELSLSAVVDDEPSTAHDLALASMGGAASLRLSLERSAPRPKLSDELEQLRIAGDASDAPENVIGKEQVRAVSMLEHRAILQHALSTADSRILLVSPWIRSAVVDDDFIRLLELRLQRGVRVRIGYGYGKNDNGTDHEALKLLGELKRRYKSRLSVSRLPDTHAKILIFDDVWISTSFNWLSFQGDAERTYRMEEGTLVRIPAQVESQHATYAALLDEHAGS